MTKWDVIELVLALVALVAGVAIALAVDLPWWAW